MLAALILAGGLAIGDGGAGQGAAAAPVALAPSFDGPFVGKMWRGAVEEGPVKLCRGRLSFRLTTLGRTATAQGTYSIEPLPEGKARITLFGRAYPACYRVEGKRVLVTI